MRDGLNLPFDEMAERTVLGSMLVNVNGIITAESQGLAPEHFKLSSHRRIYQAVLEMHAAGKPVDIISIESGLGHQGTLDVGGYAYISELTDGIPWQSDLSWYIKRILDHAMARKFITACDNAIATAQEQSEPAINVIARMEDELLALRSTQARSDAVVKVDTFTNAVYQDIIARSEHPPADDLVGFTTGIQAIDASTGGICKGEFWVIAGRTNEGKSLWGGMIAADNAARGIPVVVFTPEMLKEQYLIRLKCRLSGIPAWKFRKPWFMTSQEKSALEETAATINKWPLFFDDSSELSVEQLTARARLLARREGVQLGIGDYLQIMDAPGKDERSKLTFISKRLRGLAKTTFPFVAMSQMPRPFDKRQLNKWPTKYDLKESGSIENDASVIALLFREVDENTYLPIGKDWAIVPKHRNGAKGSEPIFLNEEHLTFEPRTAEARQ